jgi:hypothetical protein
MTKYAWERQEAGWYTSPRGGIVQEYDGWYYWPDDSDRRIGPFRSAIAAMRHADQESKR